MFWGGYFAGQLTEGCTFNLKYLCWPQQRWSEEVRKVNDLVDRKIVLHVLNQV